MGLLTFSMADLEALLDPDGWNITFKEYAQFESRCADWLVPGYFSKVSGVPNRRKRVIDSAKVIRNCIAHQSNSSFAEMNRVVVFPASESFHESGNLPVMGSVS